MEGAGDRTKYLSLVELREGKIPITYASLTYRVRIKGTAAIVLATLDTGAQCSAVRADVYNQLCPQPPLEYVSHPPQMRGVSGEELRVVGKITL